MISEFALDWNERYREGMCTIEHINRLKAIDRLTEEEYDYIINTNKERRDN